MQFGVTNKDEPIAHGGRPEHEAQSIIATARAQAQKIVQAAMVEAKHIRAQARAEGRFDEDSGQSNTIGQKWVYNKAGESMIVTGDTPEGWFDEPQK
jgi:hypothetical protein